MKSISFPPARKDFSLYLVWTGLPAQGKKSYELRVKPLLLPTHPPSRHGVTHDSGFLWAFVPFTAAGQRGIFTPLP